MSLLKRISPLISQVSKRLCSSTSTKIITSQNPDDEVQFDMENPYEKEKQQCILCKYQIKVDYKNVRLLSQFQSPYTGQLYGSHVTGLCKKQQELVQAEILKAQDAGLMPSYHKEVIYLDDPKLCNPERPLRSHPY